MRSAGAETLSVIQRVFMSFLKASAHLPAGIFGTGTKRINVSVFESVFAACCASAYKSPLVQVVALEASKIEALKADAEFILASTARTADSANVAIRLRKAREILGS